MDGAIAIGIRMDGTIDIDIQADEKDEDGTKPWAMSNLSLQRAEFLYEELGRAMKRQHERGYPKSDVKLNVLASSSAEIPSETTKSAS